MRECGIMHENEAYWVCREQHAYVVYRPSESAVFSQSDSAYSKTPGGLSLAKARCDYLAKTARVMRA